MLNKSNSLCFGRSVLHIMLNVNSFLQNRSSGVRPQALINFITLTGGGFERKQGEKPKNYTMDELTDTVEYQFS